MQFILHKLEDYSWKNLNIMKDAANCVKRMSIIFVLADITQESMIDRY